MKKTCASWKLFQRFVKDEVLNLPLVYGPLPKGYSVSYAIGICRAINDYIKEEGLHPSVFPWSAKGRRLIEGEALRPFGNRWNWEEDTEGEWVIEVSLSAKKFGALSLPGGLSDLLDAPAPSNSQLVSSPIAVEVEVEQDAQEDLIANWMKED